MKKTTKRLRTVYVIFLMAFSMFFMLKSAGFLGSVINYGWKSHCITAIEQQAAQGTWTANGLVHWTDSLVEDGEKAKQAKEDLIERDDVAKWCYYSGYSMTGKVLRVLTILIISIIFCVMSFISCMSLVAIIRRCQLRIRRTIKRARRNALSRQG